ncbi:MAG: hypothetical protein AAGG48_27945 [Planctomycetota bacterium]
MKTCTLFFALFALAMTFSFDAQSDEPKEQKKEPTYTTSALGQELIETLELAFSQRLKEYTFGRSGPEHAIRLNAQLYREQIGAASADSKKIVAEQYLARATQIETLTKVHFDNGIGLSQQYLEAKAARISAELELEKF